MTNTQLYYSLVKEFHTAFIVKSFTSVTKATDKAKQSRIKLIEEEESEYHAALAANNKLEMLDGLCDLAYVVAGTMHVMNVQVIPYTSHCPNSPVKITHTVDNVINELNLFMPCAIRLNKYTNTLLQLIDDLGAGLATSFPDAFRAVHENNMKKLWPKRPEDRELIVTPSIDGKYLVRNKEGKIIKPPDHVKVNLEPFLIK